MKRDSYSGHEPPTEVCAPPALSSFHRVQGKSIPKINGPYIYEHEIPRLGLLDKLKKANLVEKDIPLVFSRLRNFEWTKEVKRPPLRDYAFSLEENPDHDPITLEEAMQAVLKYYEYHKKPLERSFVCSGSIALLSPIQVPIIQFSKETKKYTVSLYEKDMASKHKTKLIQNDFRVIESVTL
jgi:hypothetical protein